MKNYSRFLMKYYAAMPVKPNFTVENEAQISQAPSVDFGATPAPAPPAAPEAPQPAPAPTH